MNRFYIIILSAFLSFCISGCSLLNCEIADRKSNLEECTINEKDASLFTYKGTEYRILAETVNKDDLGEWVGYIQKLAVLDSHCAVLKLQELDLSILKNSLPDNAVYVVQYLNIYKSNKNRKRLFIAVDGGFHKVLPRTQTNHAKVITFVALGNKTDEDITVNADNCTQLCYSDNIYQITDKELSKGVLKAYLGMIGTSKVFDSETKLEIPKSDVGKIEIKPGALSKQKRTSWTYGNIFRVSAANKGDVIAVAINNRFLRTDAVNY